MRDGEGVANENLQANKYVERVTIIFQVNKNKYIKRNGKRRKKSKNYTCIGFMLTLIRAQMISRHRLITVISKEMKNGKEIHTHTHT